MSRGRRLPTLGTGVGREDVREPPLSRRSFLKSLGATLAAGSLSGCPGGEPPEALPYVVEPEAVTPGRPTFYATTLELAGWGHGLVIETHLGRPTKVEGNPEHPASLGATSSQAQAQVEALYDPARSHAVFAQGARASWTACAQALAEAGGARPGEVRVLSEPTTSPSLRRELARLGEGLGLGWHVYDPSGREAALAGARLAFGRALDPVLRLDRARVVLTLDADPLLGGPGSVRYAGDLARARRAPFAGGPPARLYAVESSWTLTGAHAEHRLALRPSQLWAAAWALARGVGLPGLPERALPLEPGARRFLELAARDLAAHPGASLIVAGAHAPPALQALVHALNARLNNIGHTQEWIDPVAASPEADAACRSLAQLRADVEAGRVGTLLVLGCDPLQALPPGEGLAELLERVPLTLHAGLYRDTTARRCDWHLPLLHGLEGWGDARGFEGTAGLQQPTLAPGLARRSALQILRLLDDAPPRPDLELVRGTWRERLADERAWHEALERGVVAGSAGVHQDVTPDLARVLGGLPAELTQAAGLELHVQLDRRLHDGRFGRSRLLQELPDPITKLTWGSAALLAPEDAADRGIEDGRLLEVSRGGARVELPALIQPGHPPGVVGVSLAHSGPPTLPAAETRDVQPLRRDSADWGGPGLGLRVLSDTLELARTQRHDHDAGRELVRSATAAALARGRGLPSREDPRPAQTLLGDGARPRARRQWGMSVDLTACTGCGVCVVACQTENSIPTVGPAEVRAGRELHWIRIDRYQRQGPDGGVQLEHQPVPCMHCEHAPCELVCPTGATQHSEDGLNAMVYNRCIGTRYCSNNCPYKVRRFNFYYYAAATPTLANNPDVSVRSRGVMEKCSYCVQRIRVAERAARARGQRQVVVQTACEQACPSRAIVFGDVGDPDSEVSRRKAGPLEYALLAELNTRPRTTYTARVRHPHPELGA
ncbi:MAG: 4Fe-4S dicluster domain-containing protein [Planctomycetota bacterium]